jgi:hypothetical protein
VLSLSVVWSDYVSAKDTFNAIKRNLSIYSVSRMFDDEKSEKSG